MKPIQIRVSTHNTHHTQKLWLTEGLTEDEPQIWIGHQSHRTKSAHNDKILEFRVGIDSTPASVLAKDL